MVFVMRKREFENDLTRHVLEMRLDDILIDPLLSTSLRNESSHVIDALFNNEDYYIRLLDYTFYFKDSNSKEKREKYKLHQLNQNACNVLSNPSNKVREFIVKEKKKHIYKYIKEFLKDKARNTNRLLAGHFQRIIESMLHFSFDSVFLSPENEAGIDSKLLFNFLLNNMGISAYNELVFVILTDFSNSSVINIQDFLSSLLRKAIISVYGICQKNNKGAGQNTLSMAQNKAVTSQMTLENFLKTQPTNFQREKIATPSYLTAKTKQILLDTFYEPLIQNSAKDLKQLIGSKSVREITFDEFDFEDEKRKAIRYLFCLRRSAENLPLLFYKIANDIQNIEMILYCGVYCDISSNISTEAFRILDILFYGNNKDNDENSSFEPVEITPEFQKIIDKYAERFQFMRSELTNQMVNAYQIFWNHRYTDLFDDESDHPEANTDLVIPKYCESIEEYKYPPGITPFCYYLPLYLTEPPLSTRLNSFCFKIIDRLDRKIIKIAPNLKHEEEENDDDESDDQNNQNQSNITEKQGNKISEKDLKEKELKFHEINLIMYEFVFREFFYPDENAENKMMLSLYKACEKVCPDLKEKVIDKKERCSLNSALELIVKIKESSFFYEANESGVYEYFSTKFNNLSIDNLLLYQILTRINVELHSVNITYEKGTEKKVDEYPLFNDSI